MTALVAARDRADSVADTVAALAGLDHVESVWVVDDGSTDATAAVAAGAGAHVVRLPRNLGKGGAVSAGVAATPGADVYLLVDADVGLSAAGAGPLLEPVLADGADMTIGVLPAAGARGGFGVVRAVSRAGIARACGFRAQAPLSGQRAVTAKVLRSLDLAPRFGLETGLTIDAVRSGARVVEVAVALDHLHTGRRLAGFAHRAEQGRDVVAALWPRLPTPRARAGFVLAVAGDVFALVRDRGAAAARRARAVRP